MVAMTRVMMAPVAVTGTAPRANVAFDPGNFKVAKAGATRQEAPRAVW